jgi:hypothetical protein
MKCTATSTCTCTSSSSFYTFQPCCCSPMWVPRCATSRGFVANAFWHISHLCHLSQVWCLLCTVKFDFVVKCVKQVRQTNGFSPVCVLKMQSEMKMLENSFPKCHTQGFKLWWLTRCNLSVAHKANHLLQISYAWKQIIYYKYHMHAAPHLYELQDGISKELVFDNISDKYDKHMVFYLHQLDAT